MATKQNFESESDPKIDQYGSMYLCAKFHTFNMDSPIISHIASAKREIVPKEMLVSHFAAFC